VCLDKICIKGINSDGFILQSLYKLFEVTM